MLRNSRGRSGRIRHAGRAATATIAIVADEKSAAQFGRKAKKRTLASVENGAAEFLAGIHGSPPILLIDD